MTWELHNIHNHIDYLNKKKEEKPMTLQIVNVIIGSNDFRVELNNGTTLLSPYDLWPLLRKGTPEQLSNWRLIGQGEGIHWEELDEDISLDSLVNYVVPNFPRRSAQLDI